MKQKLILFVCLLSLGLPALAQSATLTATLTHTVASPWTVPCTATVLKNCIKGWRVFDTTGGGHLSLFDIPAPTTGFTGMVTATGSGAIANITGTVVAETIGLDSSGAETLSVDSAPSVFGSKPGTPNITITIVTNP